MHCALWVAGSTVITGVMSYLYHTREQALLKAAHAEAASASLAMKLEAEKAVLHLKNEYAKFKLGIENTFEHLVHH